MTGPGHARVSEIFLQACELEPSDRRAFLDRVCAGQASLRSEVESLLAHDARAPEILDGALSPMAMESIDRPPECVGRYRVLEKIGEGGMGVVYRAEQESPLRRVVAIKLIKRGFETREVISRFETERQTLALMQHAGIAGVIDAGATDDGRPWFCMEFVEGEAITQYCDAKRLGLRGRLELMETVCEAVQHAHQKAIIHRDIKPSNILVADVNGKPSAKIIDFGIAKALASSSTPSAAETRLGQPVGTPEYMSPEQAAATTAGVDTRTDVYSLGVVLYELLTGLKPLDPDQLRGLGPAEARRRIREDRPVAPGSRFQTAPRRDELALARATDPRQLERRLRGDLGTIVLKALANEPSRRYASVRELAADLRRYLEDRPIEARAPSRLYSFGKFVRRYRVGVAAAAGLLVLLVGFAVTMAVQAARIARERDRAGREAATAERTLAFVEELFKLSDPRGAQGNEVTAREVLDDSVHKIEAELRDQPVVQARLLALTGRVYRNLGLHDDARRMLQDAHSRQRTLLGEDHPDTLKTGSTLAFLYLYHGEHEQAEALYGDTLRRQQAVLGKGDRDALMTQKNLANLYTAVGDFERSERLHLELLGLSAAGFGDDDELTLRTRNELGILYTEMGRFDDAATYSGAALQGMRRLLGPDHPTTLSAMNTLAVIRMNQGLPDQSRSLFDETLRRKRQILGDTHPSTLKSLYNKACLESRTGRPDLALPLLEEAVAAGYASRKLRSDPDLAALRSLPGFVELLAGMDGPPGEPSPQD